MRANKDATELYLLCVRRNGIPNRIFSSLPKNRQRMLERRGGKYWLKPAFRKQFKVALTGGAFDILHMGHLHTLERAKALADILIVAIATDGRIRQVKGRSPVHNAQYRAAMVEALKPVDIAIAGGKNREEMLARIQPDLVVFGPDQKPFVAGKFKVVRLKKLLSDRKGLFKTSRIIRELEL